MQKFYRQVLISLFGLASAFAADGNPYFEEMDQLEQVSKAPVYYPPEQEKSFFASLEEGQLEVIERAVPAPLEQEEQMILDSVSSGQAAILRDGGIKSLKKGDSPADHALLELLDEVKALKKSPPLRRPRKRSR
ncbi:MAG: hypothetical protein HN509_17850 [Halobacteriovoraceae bacterium]|nr:hypothetical protein [Halobacteriovoraceae bacterium]